MANENELGDSPAWHLVQAIQELSFARRREDVQRVVKKAARTLVKSDGATFVLRDQEQCYYVDEDAISPLWKGSRFPLDQCVSGWAMMHRQYVAIPDVFVDDRVPHEAYRPTFVKSLAMMPIRRSEPIGAIGVYWSDKHQATAEELQLLQALADSTAVALELAETLAELEQRVEDRTRELEEANERLVEVSITDELTGLRNRRGFEFLAEHAFDVATREQLPCTLGFLDIDGLKAVNDKAGHEAGDRVIAEVGQVVRSCVRASDIAARIGGDEFVFLLTGEEPSAELVVERIEQKVRDLNLARTSDEQFGVSVGLASRESQTDTLTHVLEKADQEMYRAKQARRQALTA